MEKKYALTLDSDAFNAFKSDFKTILNSTLNTMQQKDVEEASIAVKFEIKLEEGYAPDLEVTGYHADREIIIPQFKHKIVATMQLKNEKSGYLNGSGYELVWDKDSGAWIMRNVDNRQMSFEECSEAAEVLELPEAQKELPEGELQEDAENNEYIDAEYEAIEDDYPYQDPENSGELEAKP